MIKVIGSTSKLNPGEEKVLEWIKAADLKRHFTVLVEPSYKGKSCKHARWPDFVLISRKFGVCILECKSHSENNVQRVTETEGIILIDEVDRYQRQLRDYYYLIQSLTENLGWAVPITKGAVFPHLSKYGKAAEAIRNHHSDSGRLFFKEDLEIQFEFEDQQIESMTTEQFNELCGALNKESIIEHNYGIDTDKIEKRILKFSPEQVEKINRVQDGNYLLHGLPGTGKTKMLVAIARREEAKDKRIGFICFNRPLRDKVAEEMSEGTVFTMSKLFQTLCMIYNLPFNLNQPELMDKSFQALLEINTEPLFDVLLIDEYQDLEENDYKILQKCIIPDGLIVLAGDPLQEIKDKEVTWKSRGIHVYGTQSMFLAKPYRTEASIVDYGLRFLSSNKNISKIIDKYFSDHHHKYIFQDSKDGVRENIHFWLYNKLTTEKTFSKIITDNPNLDILIITNYLNQHKELSIKASKNVRIEPYSRVKGLEADIVLIYNADFYLQYSSRLSAEAKMRSLFSALCRSRGRIIIHGYENKDFFRQLFELSKEYLEDAA